MLSQKRTCIIIYSCAVNRKAIQTVISLFKCTIAALLQKEKKEMQYVESQ